MHRASRAASRSVVVAACYRACRDQVGFVPLTEFAGFFLTGGFPDDVPVFLVDDVALGFPVAAFDAAALSASSRRCASLADTGDAVVATAATGVGGASKLAPLPGHSSMRGVMPAIVLPRNQK